MTQTAHAAQEPQTMTAETLRNMPRAVPVEETQANIKRMAGRPRTYDRALAEEIIAHVAQGGSIRGICEAYDHLPAPSTFHKWVLEDVGGIGERYRLARAIQARGMADDLLAIADDRSRDEGEEGRIAVQRDKLRLHARQWILGRVLPREYGDKTQVEHSTAPQATLDLDRLTDDERSTLAGLLAKATPPPMPGLETDAGPGPVQVENTAPG